MDIEVSSAVEAPEEVRPPGWVDYGMEYTLVDEMGRDPEVTKAIEALDPTFTPIGIRWIFLAPADEQTGVRETHVFRYHGIGRTSLTLGTKGWSDNEATESMKLLQLPRLEIPPSYSGRIPKYLDPTVGILDDPRWLGLEPIAPSPAEKFGAVDLPGPFVPWDWALANALKRMYTADHTVAELKESQLWTPMRRKREAQRQRVADFAADFQDFQSWAQKKLDATGDDEHFAEFEKAKERARQQRLARLSDAMHFKLHGVN